MPRRPRVEEPNGIYHVNSCGNDGRTIYHDDFDRRAFLTLLARTTLRHRWIVSSYCLMDTHYHVLVRIPHCGLSQGMKELNGGYSRQTNARYRSTGHLFHNRFFAVQVVREAHLPLAARYIERNPVRAGLVERPEDWPWSSYRATAGLVVPPLFLSAGEILGLFANDARQAALAYRRFVSAGHDRCQTP